MIICVPCLLVGGTEMHTLALARALVEGGYQVTVCAYFESEPSMVAEVEGVGARVELLGLERSGAGRNFKRMPRLGRALWGLFRRERPDAVHVQYMAPGVVPILAARAAGVRRVLATVHVPGWTYGRRLCFPRTAARLCDVFLCVSETAERSFWGSSALFEAELVRRGRRHFTIHNPVDLDLVDEIAASGARERLCRELGLDGAPVAGVVARLSGEKGHEWLLSAWRQVIRALPEARLVVVGDGPLRPSLEAAARRAGIGGTIRWLGRVAHKSALESYAVMDAVVVPSRWEGFGLSAAEGMAFGKPVVATDVGGLREVIRNGVTGRLVAYGDAAGLQRAIVGLLEDPGKAARLGAAGRQRAESHFSWAAFKQRHLRLYETLGVSRSPRRRGETPRPATGSSNLLSAGTVQ